MYPSGHHARSPRGTERLPGRLAFAILASLLTFAAFSAVTSAKAPAPGAPSASPPVHDFTADIATARQLQRQGRAREALALLAADHKLDPANRDVTVAYAQTSSYAGDQGLNEEER